MEHKKNGKTKQHRFCSWCFKKTDHRLKEEHMIGRDMYECLTCFGNGCECISCEGMARRYDDKSADKLCFKCDPRFTNEDEESLSEMGWCSWCLLHTQQILVQPSLLMRNVYKCGHCHRRTLSCRSCREGFVRGHGSYDDQLCLKCDGTIEHWHERELNFKKLSRPGWCSWCLDYSRHQLEQVNKVRRSVYMCIQCQNRTLPCNSCNIGLTRGGAGWDDDNCSVCSEDYKNQGKKHPDIFDKATANEMQDDVKKAFDSSGDIDKKHFAKWLLMQARKDVMVKQGRTEELVRKEMAKHSEFRELAAQSGMIRPFLILVAMPAFFRNKVANFLGWTLFTQPYFGDAHEEAWVILSKDMSGMMSRAIKAYERIALLNRMPWYNVVYRVTAEIFRRVDAPEMDYDDAVKISNWRNNDYMKNIEQEFLLKLGELQQRTAQMPDKVPKTQSEIEADEIIRERVIKNAGINRPEVLNYAVRLTKTIVGAPGQLTLAVFAINSAATILPALSGVAVPLTSAAALVTTPLFIIGIFSLIKDAITLGLGSSEGRLFGPLMVIMNQKILLAVEGIDIEEFMP